MAKPQVSSSDCRGLFPVLAWAAFPRFGKCRANLCSSCQRGGTAFQNPSCPAGKELHVHLSVSADNLKSLWEDLFFWHQLSARFFWALIFHVLGGYWAEIVLLLTVQSKCLAWQLNHEAFIHSISVLVNILAQPRVSLHQKQMVLPTLPTCLKSRGQKVFGELQSWVGNVSSCFLTVL